MKSIFVSLTQNMQYFSMSTWVYASTPWLEFYSEGIQIKLG